MTYDTINDARTIAGNDEGTLLANRYRVVRQLGQGGMGSVWLAEDTQLDNKLFAIKMLPSILVSNKRAYRQLKDEALVAMQLVHPNIVQIRAFEENNGNPFLVMDYVDGQTLDDYLADRAPPLGEAASRRFESHADVLRILRPIAAALDYAHSKGVVHRDVKPGNVMIAKDGTPYILDFGIAREIQETLTRVTGKPSSGTLLYMSPEQLNGARPTPAQDIYSFATMVYECLKGDPPFSHGQIEFQIMNKQPDPLPTEGLTGNAAILAAGVMAGLAKKPEVRPATCRAVLEGSGFSRVEHVERVEGGNDRTCSTSRPQGVMRKVLPFVVVLGLAVACGIALRTLRDETPQKTVRGERSSKAVSTIKYKEDDKVTCDKINDQTAMAAESWNTTGVWARTCSAEGHSKAKNPVVPIRTVEEKFKKDEKPIELQSARMRREQQEKAQRMEKERQEQEALLARQRVEEARREEAHREKERREEARRERSAKNRRHFWHARRRKKSVGKRRCELKLKSQGCI